MMCSVGLFPCKITHMILIGGFLTHLRKERIRS